MDSQILTIGDELLIGQVVNTNQAFIAEELNRIGVSVRRMSTVGDDVEAIARALGDALRESDVVVLTGGLGPTHDDVTRTAVCRVFDSELVVDPSLRGHIEQVLQRRGMPWTPAAENQTLVPRGARVLPNPVGTAPGLMMERQGRLAVILPGVPHEMTEIMVDAVVPALASRVQDSAIVHRTLRTTGISESLLAQKLGDLNPLLEGAALAFLPSPRGVRLRITVHGKNAAEANARAGEVEERIRRSIGTWVYGTEQQELEDVLGSLLKERGQSIAVAESCTGGLIADRITNVSGSSAYFERGIVAYSDRSKTELLGVPRELIDRHGAVSREVAEAMASGVRRIAGVDIGLSTTGIAGPAGGSEEKPVGLVWIGHANADGVSSVRFQFGDRRLRVKERASQAALELVRRTILKIP